MYIPCSGRAILYGNPNRSPKPTEQSSRFDFSQEALKQSEFSLYSSFSWEKADQEKPKQLNFDTLEWVVVPFCEFILNSLYQDVM